MQKADSASIEQGCPAEWWIPTEQQDRQGVNMKTSLLLAMVGVIIYFDHIYAWLEVSLSAPLPDKLPLNDYCILWVLSFSFWNAFSCIVFQSGQITTFAKPWHWWFIRQNLTPAVINQVPLRVNCHNDHVSCFDCYSHVDYEKRKGKCQEVVCLPQPFSISM